MTFEDAARLDPDIEPGDLVRGEWVPVSKNTWRHGKIVFNLCVLLGAYVRQHRDWSVSAGDPGTKLSRSPDTLRGPDVAVVRSTREPTGKGTEGWLQGAPDLAVEVIGHAQSATGLMEKALEYLGAGGQAVWIVDGDARRVIEVTPPNRFRILQADDTLEGGEVLAGFSVPVSELFDGLDGGCQDAGA
jgi:Uma2 family endonuclease